MASTDIIDLVIKKKESTWESNPGQPHHRLAHYQLSYDGDLNELFFYEAYEVTAKKVENKIMYYKETVECLHIIF
jgi:hypothetical protein